MAVKVQIPTPMRQYTEGQSVVEVGGTTVKGVLDELATIDQLLEEVCQDFAFLIDEGGCGRVVLPEDLAGLLVHLDEAGRLWGGNVDVILVHAIGGDEPDRIADQER